MMVMTVMIHIVYPASASNSIVFMHHMKPEVLQLFMSCNFNHQPYAVWDTNPDENLKSLTQPMMLFQRLNLFTGEYARWTFGEFSVFIHCI